MSKIKLSIIALFSLILCVTLFTACNNENVDEPKNSIDVDKVLFSKYSLVKSKNSTVNLANVNSQNRLNTFDNVDEYTIQNSESRTSEDSFEITKEMNIDIEMDANGNGSLNVKNLTANEEFTSTLVEGVPTDLQRLPGGNSISVGLC
jgi:hypothetical protein